MKAESQLPSVNIEHVFPDSIGGTADYVVRVDAKTNAELGTTVDATFVDSPILAMFRTQYGIKSRSGLSKWKLRGLTTETQREVNVTFGPDNLSFDYVKPIEFDDGRNSGMIVATSENRDKVVTEITKNFARKGKTLIISGETTQQAEPIKIDISVELVHLTQGLTKIAYLAVYDLLGDLFLEDPLIPEWHKGIFATDPDIARSTRIRGMALTSNEGIEHLLPKIQEYEHAVVVCNLEMTGPIVVVRLFGSKLLTAAFLASESSNYSLGPLEGKIAICDTRARKTRFLAFADHIVSQANQLAGELGA